MHSYGDSLSCVSNWRQSSTRMPELLDPDTGKPWDGKPKILLTLDQMMYLYSFCPQWAGVVVGPEIPFASGRARVDVGGIFRSTYDEALFAAMAHVQEACRIEGFPFDSEQWEVQSLTLENSC